MLKRIILIILGLVIVLIAAEQIRMSQKQTNDSQPQDAVGQTESNIELQPTEEPMATAPKMTIDPAKSYTATLHTEKGDIVVSLNAKQTPITVNNFVTLARKKFYDGTVFHRTIKGFMIQGGDPTGTGRGGPGYRFDDEPFEGTYSRGTLAMANAGPDTNGSQFFIMHQDYDLSPDYTIFGTVIEGIEAVDTIATAPVTASGMGESSTPVTPVKITSVEITEK